MTEEINIEKPTNFITAVRSPAFIHQTLLITWETAIVATLAIIALFARLWLLGARVMSHDESLHVYYSWLLATGKGFVHNPMMHGAFLFEATALMNVLFGANDFTSRLVPVILGIVITVIVPRLLKPWLGQTGALITSILLVISPFILYFSRYIRHDILVIAWVLLAVIAIFRYLESREERELILLAAALALMLATMEISFIYLAIFASFLLASGIGRYKLSWVLWRSAPEFDLLIVLITLGAFFSSPIALPILNPLWSKFAGSSFVGLETLSTQGIEWSTGASGIRLWGLFGLFAAVSTIIGLWWNRDRWLKLAGLFLAIVIVLFTTFFRNPAGIGTGFIGSLGYWLSQQEVARGSQPWYYYLIVFPIYEYLPLIGGILATATLLFFRKSISAAQQPFVLFLIWWAAAILIGLSLAGEKMPWLSTHIAIPFILLTGWWIGRLIENLVLEWHTSAWKTTTRWTGVIIIVLLSVATVRTSIAANYINYDYTTEFIDYAHGAPGVKWTLNDINAIANHTGAGLDLKIAYDDQVSWPMTWYLRNYRNAAYYGAEPNREALDAPVVLAGPKNWNKVEAILGNRYHRFELIRMWWPMEEYKNLTWERIRNAFTDPSMRQALWQIFWNRDYRKYAGITGQPMNPPATWPLQESMRVYVDKEIALQMLSLDIGSTMLEDLPPPVDAYAGVQRSVVPDQVIANVGLNSPRGIALAPDGSSVYVADTGNSRIVRLDSSGNILTSWGSRTPDGQLPPASGTFIEPWGIAVDSAGNVYVADTWNHRIQKFDANGNFKQEWGSFGQEGADYLWGPRGIAISADGHVYVTDTGNKRVVVFDSNGKFLQEFGRTEEIQLDEPVGIAADSEGNIYVADTWNLQVVVFSPEGNLITKWPVQGWEGDSLDNKPYIAVDSEDRVYITDPERYRVIVFSSSGAPLAAFGQYGPEEDAFGLPVGVAANSGGTIWIVDAGNNRLVKFDLWK